MLCKNCGAEMAEDAKFCVSCGSKLDEVAEQAVPVVAEENVEAPVESPAAPAEPKENPLKSLPAKLAPLCEKIKPIVQKNKMAFVGIGCVVLLVLAIAIIASLFGGGNGFIAAENAIVATSTEDDEVIILWNDKVIETGIEAYYIDEQATNLDSTVLAFLTDEGELYVVKNKKVTAVAEEVSSFSISVDGNGIAYVAEDDDEYSLNLYNVSKKKSVTIMDECSYMALSYYGYALSPDGKTMAYYEFDEDEYEATLMFFDGKKSIKITSSEVELMGLSNGGKYIYVIGDNDGDDVLYTYNKKGEREKIGKCSNSIVYFNDDHTQILYLNDNKTYISAKGKAGEKLSSSRVTLLNAPGSVTMRHDSCYTYPVDDLYGHVYAAYSDGEYNIWQLEKNSDKSVKLVSNVDGYRLDAACEYLYYVNEDYELCVLKIAHGDKASDRAIVLAEDVDNYVVTSDSKTVYFISDDALYSCKATNGKSKRTIASDDVESYYLALNAKDVVYYVMDGDCYSCSNGKKGTKVLSDVEGLMGYGNGVVYAGTEDALYGCYKSKKLEKMYDME